MYSLCSLNERAQFCKEGGCLGELALQVVGASWYDWRMSDRILIVDDKAANRRLLRLRLESEFFLVDEASSREKALNKLAMASQFSAVITDLSLEGGEAISLCKEMRSVAGAVFLPILVVTASLDYSFKMKALRAGADDYIVRPLNFPLLFSRLRGLIRKKVARDQLLIRYGGSLSEEFFGLPDDCKVLLVEGDDHLQKIWQKALRHSGMKTLGAAGLPVAPGWPMEATEHDLLVINQEATQTRGCVLRLS